MTNIAELLKDAPKGMKLYSPLFGEVEYMQLCDENKIWVKTSCGTYYFDKYGKPYAFNKAECLLFPSKDCRTWEGWKAPVEPKFKVGDWVVYCGKTYQITNIGETTYTYTSLKTGSFFFNNIEATDNSGATRLWTIADAKDGDALVSQAGSPFIFREDRVDVGGRHNIIAHCGITTMGSFTECSGRECWTYELPKPATKEQVTLLFAKMKEAGYEWDADKKELRKIQPHYDIANFKPFDKVLVRYYSTDNWKCGLFSHLSTQKGAKFVCVDATYYQCIPFNDDNKHLLGTTDMPSEEYINW